MLQFISTFLAQFRREDEEGQTLVEYGLLLALIAIIVIVALIFLGPIISQIFQNVGTTLQHVLTDRANSAKPPASPRGSFRRVRPARHPLRVPPWTSPQVRSMLLAARHVDC